MNLVRSLLSGFQGAVTLEVTHLPAQMTTLTRTPDGHLLVGDESVISGIESDREAIIIVRVGTGKRVSIETADGPVEIESSESRGWRRVKGVYEPISAGELASPHDAAFGITPKDAFPFPRSRR